MTRGGFYYCFLCLGDRDTLSVGLFVGLIIAVIIVIIVVDVIVVVLVLRRLRSRLHRLHIKFLLIFCVLSIEIYR